MERNQLAKALFDTAHITGSFLLRSGQTSSEYFDKYLFQAQPHLLKAVGEHMVSLLPDNYDLLGAMEMGGIPVASAIAMNIGRPMVFLRKEAKKYGTCKFAEGPEIKGQKICIIEDVITTGGAVIDSTNMLREAGAEISDVICVIDRSQGNHDRLQSLGLKVTALFTMDELKNVGHT